MVRKELLILPKSLKLQSRYNSSMKCELQPFVLYNLESGPKVEVSITRDEAIKYLKDMTIVRRMQLDAFNMYAEKLIRGFLHLSSGQEAICVGGKASIKPEDTVITAYRSHGWLYMMGASLAGILCELTGRNTGLSKGKGGSMHMYTHNYYGSNGIVGAQVPVGNGIGFAHKYTGSKGVSFTLYGDGAANQGQVFESYNLAKLWGLPTIFICENNLYGYATSIERSSASTKYYSRAGYIPGVKLNAMDVLAVKEAMRFAREYVIAKSSPIVMEFLTYRYYGHSMSDPGTSYRSREEVNKVRDSTDPITIFKNKMLKGKLITEADIKKIDEEAKKLSGEAAAKARADKESEISELYYDLYSNCLHNKIRHILPWKSIPHKLTQPKPPKNIK